MSAFFKKIVAFVFSAVQLVVSLYSSYIAFSAIFQLFMMLAAFCGNGALAMVFFTVVGGLFALIGGFLAFVLVACLFSLIALAVFLFFNRQDGESIVDAGKRIVKEKVDQAMGKFANAQAYEEAAEQAMNEAEEAATQQAAA